MDADDVRKGKIFIENLQKLRESEGVKIVTATGRISAENLKLFGLGAMSPKGQAVVVTAVVARKAMHAAGLATKDETMRCLLAIAKLGSTLAVGAAAAPATFGASAGLALAVATMEGYEVGDACFNNDGHITHAVTIPAPK